MTFFSVGCTSAPPSNPSSAQCRAVPLQTEEAQIFVESTDSLEQREAQRAWCEYLDALHRRAGTSRAMPGLEKCLQARTYAAPKMLRQTARCSRVALEQFDGDPFTREYAAAVARCGAEALDACEAANADVVPVMATICSSVARCSDSNVTECSALLEGRLKIHLSRAIGAMNEQGRDVFQNCLQKMTCNDVAGQVVACLEPIMEGLLWLPE
ncbi:MAG TPA: hypothetical protein PK156_43905 [Polyangium sp.]|nr:hypothetical protein [Polyangium sp.]